MKKIVRGGTLVLPEAVAVGDLWIEDGIIRRIMLAGESGLQSVDFQAGGRDDDWSGAQVIEAEGCFVMPGLIDLHCDAIEKEVQPRPGTLFPLEASFREFERKLPLHGITSMYHSLSLGVGLSLRGDDLFTRMVDYIRSYRKRQPIVRNGIHIRYEISHLAGFSFVERYVRQGAIEYLSFMDHAPGQGQYRKPGSFERYVMKNQGVGIDEVGAIVQDLMERRERVDWAGLRQLAKLAAANGIPVASHDDDTEEAVRTSKGLGCTVSEFPITMETAAYAVKQGMYVCVGAPNVVRGASHDGNLRAADAVASGAANVLCSDYHPSSMLLAIFKLADEEVLTLPEATAMASLQAARAVGVQKRRGSIAQGKDADLIIVRRNQEGHPYITHTFVGGTVVYRSRMSGHSALSIT